MRKTGIIMLAALLLVAFSMAIGQDAKKEVKKEVAKKTVAKAEHVNLEGTLVCLGCELKTNEGAKAACSVYGHTHALKTADGKYVNLLPNQYSVDLFKGEKYHNKAVKVHGVFHASANQLDVENYTVDGSNMSWCEGHKGMDACMAAKSGK